MKKIIYLSFIYLFLFSGLNAQVPDDDKDGIPNSDDLCPFVAGTKANRGCPEEKKATTPVTFIDAVDFSKLLKDIYNNNFPLYKQVKLVNNKSYVTNYKKNGPGKNLPVSYIPKDANSFSLLIPLSNNKDDLETIAVALNKLLLMEACCGYGFNKVKLVYRETSNSYGDVLAFDDFGLLFSLKSETIKQKQQIRLSITRVNYETKSPTPKPVPVITGPNICDSIKLIIQSCQNNFEGVMGKLVREEPPSKYHTTTLPKLACPDTYVANSVSIEVVNGAMKRTVYRFYSTEQNFSDKKEALEKYTYLKSILKKCNSGTAEELDNNSNKVYTMEISQGNSTLIAKVVYVDLFDQIVSLSFRLKQ